MQELLHNSINLIVNYIGQIGYVGIFIGMFLESTLVPIPSEVVMIPAGIASAKGVINIYLATLFGILGNIAGAVFSYYLALIFGRKIIFKIGKYFWVKETTIIKIEVFFEKYGALSVFIGRLLPGFRHFISLPAGLAKMNFKLFLFYTSLGSAIWTSILSAIGYLIGENEALIHKYLHQILIFTIIFCISLITTALYFKRKRRG